MPISFVIDMDGVIYHGNRLIPVLSILSSAFVWEGTSFSF